MTLVCDFGEEHEQRGGGGGSSTGYLWSSAVGLSDDWTLKGFGGDEVT